MKLKVPESSFDKCENIVSTEVRGLPIVGNLLQLKEKKPLKAFKKWAEIYGPIYSVRTGASTVVVLNSADLAKEVTAIAILQILCV